MMNLPRKFSQLALRPLVAAIVAFGTVGDSQASEHSRSTPPLTPEYLQGRWCYAHIDFGSQREEINIEYLFNLDGSLEYQVNSDSDRMKPGSYSIGDGNIDIRPTMLMFDLRVERVEANTFVLEAMGGKHYFLRGDC
jgi:hypothetical protein